MITQEYIVTQIQDFQRQKQVAKENYDRLVAECDGGIKTCTWMLEALINAAKADAEKKAADDKAAAEKKALEPETPDLEHQGQDLTGGGEGGGKDVPGAVAGEDGKPGPGGLGGNGGDAAVYGNGTAIGGAGGDSLLMPRAPGRRKKAKAVTH